MISPEPDEAKARQDAREAEFLLGNALLKRTLEELEFEAVETAMNAYAAGNKATAELAMVTAHTVREVAIRINELLRTKAARKPVV